MQKQRLKGRQKKCAGCALHKSEKEIAIRSESVNLATVRNHIREIGESCNLSERQIFDLQVAVGEATANAIEHGSPVGPDNIVLIKARCDGKALVIVVKDQGKFKRRMPDPGIEQTNFRGRGIPLMLALMDRVTIDEGKEGTSVILMKKIVNDDSNGVANE
ncbi:MAG: ATP-binding protein [Firmicutes bacterium]|nr:ATP-binding protein [Bacillota bacterium]